MLASNTLYCQFFSDGDFPDLAVLSCHQRPTRQRFPPRWKGHEASQTAMAAHPRPYPSGVSSIIGNTRLERTQIDIDGPTSKPNSGCPPLQGGQLWPAAETLIIPQSRLVAALDAALTGVLLRLSFHSALDSLSAEWRMEPGANDGSD